MEHEDKRLEELKRAGKKEDMIGCFTVLVVVAIIFILARGCTGSGDNKINGLGVSRDRIISSLAEKGFAFSGKEDNQNKQQRWIGNTADELSNLELVGEKNELSTINLSFAVPNNDTMAAAQDMIYMSIILGDIFPQWDDRNKWIVSAINQIKDGKAEVIENKDGKYIKFTAIKSTGVYVFSVTSKPDK